MNRWRWVLVLGVATSMASGSGWLAGVMTGQEQKSPPRTHAAVVEDMLKALTEMNGALTSAVDEASAKQAAPKVAALAGKMQALAAEAGAMGTPDAATGKALRETFGGRIKDAMAVFTKQSERIQGDPALKAVLGDDVTKAAAAVGGRSHEDVMDDMLATMDEISDVLAKVTDEASAKAAKPKLETLTARMQAIQKEANAMGKPDAATEEALQKKYEARLQQVMGRFMKEMMRVSQDPTISAELSDAMGKMGG